VRIDLLDLGVEFLRTDVPPQLEEYARDIVTLAGRFQPTLAQPRMEYAHPIVGRRTPAALDYRAAALFADIFARHRGLYRHLFGPGLQDTPGSRRKINGFEIATAQRLGKDFDLVGRRLIAIEDQQVLIAQPAGAAPRAITDLAQDLFAPHFESHPLGCFSQFIDQPQNPGSLVFAHCRRDQLRPRYSGAD